jgi:hypothetical protein
MEETSAFSPLGDQSRKSRTAKRWCWGRGKKVVLAVLLVYVSCRTMYDGTKTLKSLGLSMERANVDELTMTMADPGLDGRAMSPAILLQTIPPNNSLEMTEANRAVLLTKKSVRAVITPLSELTMSSATGKITCPEPLVPVYDRVVNGSSYTSPRAIPRNVHLSMKSRCMPKDLASNVQRWKDALPFHSVYFHDDAAVERLIKEEWPEFPLLSIFMKCVRTRAP